MVFTVNCMRCSLRKKYLIFPDYMHDKIPNDDQTATKYLLKWMVSVNMARLDNPEAFIKIEPGLYIGGLKCMPEDSVVTDNHGLQYIIRAGYCE